MTIESGAAAESTELGIVVNKIIEFVEGLDLPTSLDDLQVVFIADGGGAGVCAGTEGTGDERAVAAALMQHAAILLKHYGISMEVMTDEELGQLIEAQAKA